MRVPAKATLRRQKVQCGKARCKKWHGPYWYAFWRGENGRTRSAYIGKDARLAVFLRERDGGDVVDPVVEERSPATRRKAMAAEERPRVVCLRCGQAYHREAFGKGGGYCWPSRAWIRKHPRDKGAWKHVPTP